MNDLMPVLFIAILALVIGLVTGLLIASLRGGSREVSAQSDPEEMDYAVRVWQPSGSARLHVDVQGRNIASPAFLDGEEREQVRLFTQQLIRWLGESTPLAPPVTPMQHPDESYEPTARAQKIASPSALGVFFREAPAKPVVRSIAAQVDEILQARLEELTGEGNPIGTRSIHIRELPGRGVVVAVEGKEYEGVSAVPDPEVRELLRECVLEWEGGSGAD